MIPEHAKVSAGDVAHMLMDARARTLTLIANLTDEQLMGPRLKIVNPLLWEIGHVAWFQEKWVLRHRGKEKPIRADGDTLYDSARVPHDTRWDLPFPSREETLAYMQRVMNRIIERLGAAGSAVRLRQREVGPSDHAPALSHRTRACDQRRVRRLRGGQGVPQAGILE